jgi:CDP-diglyceride synthetase
MPSWVCVTIVLSFITLFVSLIGVIITAQSFSISVMLFFMSSTLFTSLFGYVVGRAVGEIKIINSKNAEDEKWT